MKKLLYIIMLALPFAFAACDNDDVDGPSEDGLSVDFPQGNHDYDQEFVNFKKEYGSMVLYKFTNAQFRWAFTEYIPFYANQADEAYVQKAWNLVKEGIDLWPKDFAKKCMPYQIMLCDSIWCMKDGDWVDGKQQKVKSTRNSCAGYSHIAFGFANSSVDRMTVEQKKEVMGDVAYAMVAYATAKANIAIPESFDTLFTKWKNNYNESSSGAWGYNGAGALDGTMPHDKYTESHDFATYVKFMVMYSPETFERLFLNDDFDCGGTQYDANWNVIPEHRIRQKYIAVCDYFKDVLGIDLGAIGTRVEQMQ